MAKYKHVKAKAQQQNGTERRRVRKRVKSKPSLANEATFLKAAGWTQEDYGDHVVYSGPLDGGDWGFIDGLVYDEPVRNSHGKVIAHNLRCYVHDIPVELLNGKHQECFTWREDLEKVLVHFNPPPKSIQQAVLSMEHVIRDS